MFIKKNIKNFFYNLYQPKPCIEVINASFNKIPDRIEISWFRDGKFIIGTIVADGDEYMTQAVSAKEFVDMVNDTLLAVYEIPKNCFSIIKKQKRFVPPEKEFEKLNNAAVKHARISFTKENKLATT